MRSKEKALLLLKAAPSVAPTKTNNDIYRMFADSPALESIVVVKDEKPMGLLTRNTVTAHYARQFEREIFGEKSCTKYMDNEALIFDQETSLQDISKAIVNGDRRHLFNGFIITREGKYLGMGTGHDLMREITQMQINAARYANALTQLPGNVPINDQISSLLEDRMDFRLCYIDIDHFKPFNDVYGYRNGDDVIELVGRILVAHTEPEIDFLGHSGPCAWIPI